MKQARREAALGAAINGAMGRPAHDHGGNGPDYGGCACDGTLGNHYSGHVLRRLTEAGWKLVRR